VHPLDRPVWSALTSRQAHLALGSADAVQLPPDYGPFAAAATRGPASLAALRRLQVGPDGLWLVEAEPPFEAAPAGFAIGGEAHLDQMLLERLTPGPALAEIEALTDGDAPQMRALAQLTRPGPFAARTHQLGDFFGVKEDGRLIAMAGERMRATGYTEVSGVCTHPDARGRGLAEALTRHVAERILARGEGAFLHVYPTNAGAIALYEKLGFRKRRTLTATILTRAEAGASQGSLAARAP